MMSPGLAILKRNHPTCLLANHHGASMCYTLRGSGGLIQGAEDKLYILTCAHLFTDEMEEYLLTPDFKTALFTFQYKKQNTEEEKATDTVAIPVDEYKIKHSPEAIVCMHRYPCQIIKKDE